MENWRIFWAAITFFQGLVALCCDIGNGYANTNIAQGTLIVYTVAVSVLGTVQYLTNYFYFMKSDYFDSHLVGNLILATWLLGLFEVGWIVGIFTIIISLCGIIYRLVSPYDAYQEDLQYNLA